MTVFTQRDSVRDVGKFLPENLRRGLVLIHQILERNYMVDFDPNAMFLGIAAALLLTCPIVTFVAGVAPIDVDLRFPETLAEFRNTASPVPVVLSGLERATVLLGGDMRNPAVVPWKIVPYSVVVSEARDFHHAVASAFTEVLTGILGNPLVLNTFVVRSAVVAGVLTVDLVSFSECAVCSSFWIKHDGGLYGSNRGLQEKSGELQETPLAKAKGNLQRSRWYTGGTFIDYRSGTARLITGFSARPERDEIVSAPRNRGSHVRAFTFNGAEVVVDQYCPSGQMFGLNTRNENLLFFTSTLQRYQFGFTGFKEAQNTDDRAGQYLWAGNVIVTNPRYNFRLTGIPTLS